MTSSRGSSCGAARASFAGVLVDAFAARPTLDLAAPVKRAFTLPLARVDRRVVAAAAAHRLTAGRHRLRRVRRLLRPGPVAAPAARPQRPDGRVALAVARRRVQVDEVPAHRLPVGRCRHGPARGSAAEAQGDGAHGSAAVDRLDAARSAVAGREAVADGAEARQSDPAGLHRARSRHAVAHALGPHRSTQRLQQAYTSTQHLELLVTYKHTD